MGSKRLKQIALKPETYQRLTRAGVKGETYDQIVSRLLDLWIERFAENLKRVKPEDGN